MKKLISISLICAFLLCSCTSVSTDISESKSSAGTTSTTITTTTETVTSSDNDNSTSVTEDAYYIWHSPHDPSDESNWVDITDSERVQKIDEWIDKVLAEKDEYLYNGDGLPSNSADCYTILKHRSLDEDSEAVTIDLGYMILTDEEKKDFDESKLINANFTYQNVDYVLSDEYIYEIYELITGEKFDAQAEREKHNIII